MEKKQKIGFILFILPFLIVVFSVSAEVTITQQVSGEGVYTSDTLLYYIPGKSVNITISFTNTSSENVLALGLQSYLPLGWQFQGISTGTNTLAVFPSAGKISDGTVPFEFAWIQIPAFPFEFTFSVNIPSDFQGVTEIHSQSLYRYTGGQLTSNIAQTSFEGGAIPQEGEGQTEGEGEKPSCMERVFSGCNSGTKTARQQPSKFLFDLLFVLTIIGTLGVSRKSK